MARLILLNKPFGAICQFSPSGARATLKDFVPVPNVYPAGRLDPASGGLVILTDDGAIQARMAEAVGLPTLRLVRIRIGSWDIEDLKPGEWREAKPDLARLS